MERWNLVYSATSRKLPAVLSFEVAAYAVTNATDIAFEAAEAHRLDILRSLGVRPAVTDATDVCRYFDICKGVIKDDGGYALLDWLICALATRCINHLINYALKMRRPDYAYRLLLCRDDSSTCAAIRGAVAREDLYACTWLSSTRLTESSIREILTLSDFLVVDIGRSPDKITSWFINDILPHVPALARPLIDAFCCDLRLGLAKLVSSLYPLAKTETAAAKTEAAATLAYIASIDDYRDDLADKRSLSYRTIRWYQAQYLPDCLEPRTGDYARLNRALNKYGDPRDGSRIMTILESVIRG